MFELKTTKYYIKFYVPFLLFNYKCFIYKKQESPRI